jgi:hypothetical protein
MSNTYLLRGTMCVLMCVGLLDDLRKTVHENIIVDISVPEVTVVRIHQ